LVHLVLMAVLFLDLLDKHNILRILLVFLM